MCRRFLAQWGAGKRIEDVIADDDSAIRTHLSTKPSDAVPGGLNKLQDALVGQVAGEPIRLGKRLGWPIGTHGLMLHLGMTGRWRTATQAPRWGRLGLHFEGGQTAWFIDPRRFGCVALVDGSQMLELLGAGLGPDALIEPPTGGQLAAALRGKRALKVALLDQRIVAGLGNIHAVEALWRAGIHPAIPCNALTAAAADALALAIPKQLNWALQEQGGDEDLVYVTDGGDNPFAVYGKEKEPCSKCGTAIEKSVMGGRSTFWCPSCQPIS